MPVIKISEINFFGTWTWIAIAQILVIAITVFLFYKRFIRGTGSEKLVHGLIMLGGIWITSYLLLLLRLRILGSFLHYVAMFLAIGSIVIFQPELRKFLGLMGQQFKFIQTLIRMQKTDVGPREKTAYTINEVIKAIEYFSHKHIGALIVFKDDMDGIVKRGVRINSEVSSELLITIFFNKTPLHDGAVVIGNNRILCAGAILPLTETTLKWKYGTRHRAAIGMSEKTDAYVLVVSEETGGISLAKDGNIESFENADGLRAILKKAISRYKLDKD
ncbi:MAG: diadenylate cyclase CdaA [Rickettsiales bacterium]|jgi:diadenylate cyclase|nr:diadenylate cyclase CdaA [Rickettsiales bacterium]